MVSQRVFSSPAPRPWPGGARPRAAATLATPGAGTHRTGAGVI